MRVDRFSLIMTNLTDADFARSQFRNSEWRYNTLNADMGGMISSVLIAGLMAAMALVSILYSVISTADSLTAIYTIAIFKLLKSQRLLINVI